MTLCVCDRLWIIARIEQLLDLAKQAQSLKHLQKIAQGDPIGTAFQGSNGRCRDVGQVTEFLLRQTAQLPRQRDPDAQALEGAAHHDGNGSRFRASQWGGGAGHRSDSRCFRCYENEKEPLDVRETWIDPHAWCLGSRLGVPARLDQMLPVDARAALVA